VIPLVASGWHHKGHLPHKNFATFVSATGCQESVTGEGKGEVGLKGVIG